MDILVGNGIRTEAARVIIFYWVHLLIVTRTGKYCGNPFQVSRRVTQRGPLPPTIFNTVVDAGIWHWVMLVTGEDAGPERFRKAVQWLTAFFTQMNKVSELMIFISALIDK